MFYCSSFFFSSRDLRDPSADLEEILPHVRKHIQFINAGPKVWGSPPQKKIRGKTRDFGHLPNLSASIYGTDRDIQKWKNKLLTAFPPALDG